MEVAANIAQVIIALGIFNVWILRPGKSTAYRPGQAGSIMEEFAAYGLPRWAVFVVGGLKLALAVALLVGLWFPAVARVAALGMAVLMAGAIAMHLKAGDPPKKSLPAASLLTLSLLVALFAG